jgi:hypothetical protein
MLTARLAGSIPWGCSSRASTLGRVGRPAGGLDAELLCVLGVQSLPAAEPQSCRGSRPACGSRFGGSGRRRRPGRSGARALTLALTPGLSPRKWLWSAVTSSPFSKAVLMTGLTWSSLSTMSPITMASAPIGSDAAQEVSPEGGVSLTLPTVSARSVRRTDFENAGPAIQLPLRSGELFDQGGVEGCGVCVWRGREHHRGDRDDPMHQNLLATP